MTTQEFVKKEAGQYVGVNAQQQLSAELERAGKIVEAAKSVLLFAETDGYIVNGYRSKECVLELQQTLNEYDTATKEPGTLTPHHSPEHFQFQ